MPDTYVKLPNGKYVQIPEGASPEQLQQMKSRLVQMQTSPEQQAPDATAQARAFTRSQIKPLIPGTGTVDPSGGLAEAQKSPAYQDYMKSSGAMAAGTAGGMAGGALAPSTAGLPAAIRALATGSSIGAGTGAGQLALDPAHPGEAISAAAGTTMAATAIPPLAKWLTSSKSVGAKALQAASAKAGNAPVELSYETNKLVDDIITNEKLGGQPVKGVTDLLKRLGPAPGQAAEAVPGPLSYDEARILQSNIGNEIASGTLKGRTKSLATGLVKSFAKDVQAGADAAGAGPEHAIGMREYAAASSRNRVLTKAMKYGTGAAGIGELLRFMQQQTKR